MQKMEAARQGLIPTERFAQQEEKIVNGELQEQIFQLPQTSRWDVRGMILVEKIVWSLAALVGSVIIALIAAFWWAGLVPNRPDTVNADAVFLSAPAVG